MVKYIARLNIALNRCSVITDFETRFLFKENLWAEIAVQEMNCQPSSQDKDSKDTQAAKKG